MKHNCILFIFVFTIAIANTQTKLDSLYNVWEDKTQADSSRVNALKEYIWDGYMYSIPDSAMVFADRLYEFSKVKEYKKGMALGIHTKGVVHYMQGNYNTALKYYNESLKIKEAIDDKMGVSRSLHNIGIIHQYQGNNIKALSYYKNSIKLKEEIQNFKEIPGTLNGIGSIYKDQGDYLKALEFYKKSLKYSEDYKDDREIVTSLNNIGLIYSDISDQRNAMSYFERALAISEKMESQWHILQIIGNIGLVNEREGEYKQALQHYERSLMLSEQLNNKRGITLMMTNIAAIYRKQGEFEKALQYFLKSLKISEENEATRKIVLTMNNIGFLYLIQKNYPKAIEYCNKTFDLAVKTNRLNLQKESCECLYFAYKGLGNGSRALAYHEQMLELKDSLQTEETAKELQRMEFSKQILADSLLQVEKDLKIEMAHQTEIRQKNKNKNIALGAGIFFLLLSGGLYSRWRYVKKSKAVIEKEKDRSENLLLNILPFEIAEELKVKGSADARDFEMVTILFTDFKGFTQAAEKLTAKDLIKEINHCFMAFDHICERHGVEKIKTIGDAYMAAGGLPVPSEDAVTNVVLAALDMQAFIDNRILEKRANNETPFQMRLGIHTGPVVAGIVGVKKFQYDIWGDTVNTASRMESSGEIGRVNISEDTYNLIKNDPQFTFEARGKVQAKGKGEVVMYFVDSSKMS